MNPEALKGGKLHRLGLLDEEALARAAEAIARLEAEGVETVRLSFPDQHGVLRGKTIVVSALASAFRSGVTMTSTLILKDTSGRTVFDVWGGDIGFGAGVLTGAGDMLMVPDPATLRVLPWADRSAWILCDIVRVDGEPIPFASRTVLRRQLARLAEGGLSMVCGLEVEFHVFRREADHLAHADGGMPANPPDTSLLSHGYQYLTEQRYDVFEPISEELRRHCVALGLPVRSMEIEFGASQYEFTFDPADPMAHADGMILFRSMVKQVALRMGLHATFMCRPKVEHGVASGWHFHQSVVDGDGRNLFVPAADGSPSAAASAWIAGLLEHAHATCVLTTPTVNGYKRYQPFVLAPDRVQWGYDNKGAMIRALMAPGEAASRIENRVAEPAANPYYYFASQIACGLDGLIRGLAAPPPVESPYASDAVRLPASLGAALDAFSASAFYREAMGDVFVDYLSFIKRKEWERYLATVSEWEQREYFTLF